MNIRGKPLALYDVTRLLARRNAVTPTGIDRVDVRYALYLLESVDYEAAFVCQRAGRFFLANPTVAGGIVRALERRWLNSCEDQPFDDVADFGQGVGTKVDRWLRGLFVGIRSELRGVLSRKAIKAVDAILLKYLLENRDREIVYLNCSHQGVGAGAAYDAFKAVANVKIVFYLHDLIPIDYPEFVRKGGDIAHARRVSAMATYGDLVLVNSGYTKRRFENFCRRNDLRRPKTQTLFVGIEDGFLAGAEKARLADSHGMPHLKGPYFIAISTIEPRKNHLLLLQVWRRLSEERGRDCPKLVILGRRGWNNQNVFHMLDRCKAIAGSVLELKGLSDDHLVRLLRRSRALLSPSFAEGWGMPIVEAMVLGVPVICSDIPAHHESAQERAEFIDPLDENAWYRAVVRLVENNAAVEAARAKQAGYSPPSWHKHFRLLEAELGGILQNGDPRTPVGHLTGSCRRPLRHGDNRAQVPDSL